MIRLRFALFLLAITVFLAAGAPLAAGTAVPGLSPSLAPPAAGSWLDAGQCGNPAASPAVATPVAQAAIIIPPNFILCTCKLCLKSPDTICQISPSGYSILCEDWARTHC